MRIEKMAAALLVGGIFFLVALAGVRHAHTQTLPVIGDVPENRLVDTYTGSGSAASAVVVFSVDTTGFGGVAVQLTGVWVGTVTFETSNDNVNWAVAGGLPAQGGTVAATATANGIWSVPSMGQYFRARVTAYTSGTVVAAYVLRSNPVGFAPTVVLSSGTLTTGGTVNPIASASVATKLTNARVKAAATTNSTLVKAAAGNVYGWQLCNTTAAAKFFKWYNKATAPTVGTDTPVMTVLIPATGCTSWESSIGIAFSLGSGYGITGAVADTDATATAIDDVTGAVWFQ